MVIAHNLSALTLSNQLKKSNINKNKSVEKLSSGLKINRASDNSAGLAISEKMKAQIRGLDQCSRNIEDGISLIQTAEGALGEIENPSLQRMRELAIKASNDTLTDEDRNIIQQEFDQIKNSIENISTNTQFNGLSLLNGKYDKNGNLSPSDSLSDTVNYVTTTGGVTDKYTYSSTPYASAKIDFTNITSSSDISTLVGKGVNYTCCTCNKTFSIKFVAGTPDTSRLNDANPVMEVDVSSISNGTDLVNKIVETAYGQAGFVFDPTSSTGTGGLPSGANLPSGATSFVKHFSQLAADGAQLYIYDDRPEEANLSWPKNGSGVFKLNVFGESNSITDRFLFLDMQTGCDSGQNVKIKIPNTTIKQLGISELLVSPHENANLAIKKIDNAMDFVSSARATLGSYQNTFEHIANNVSNYSENLTASNSRIQDTNIAKEIMEENKYSIIEQASQSLLAQANQTPNKVLELLKL